MVGFIIVEGLFITCWLWWYLYAWVCCSSCARHGIDDENNRESTLTRTLPGDCQDSDDRHENCAEVCLWLRDWKDKHSPRSISCRQNTRDVSDWGSWDLQIERDSLEQVWRRREISFWKWAGRSLSKWIWMGLTLVQKKYHIFDKEIYRMRLLALLQVCLIYSVGELSLVEYGRNEILGCCRTEHISPFWVSVAFMEGRGSLVETKRLAYLVDLQTIRVQDLITKTNLASIAHDTKIDWLVSDHIPSLAADFIPVAWYSHSLLDYEHKSFWTESSRCDRSLIQEEPIFCFVTRSATYICTIYKLNRRVPSLISANTCNGSLTVMWWWLKAEEIFASGTA